MVAADLAGMGVTRLITPNLEKCLRNMKALFILAGIFLQVMDVLLLIFSKVEVERLSICSSGTPKKQKKKVS